MKELVSAFSQAMANRLRAPILGSFILAWLAVNHTEIMRFFYSTPEAKLLLLNQETVWFVKSWSAPILMKVVYPFLAALAYTFGLPLIQHLIDVRKHQWIDGKRIKAQHKRLQDEYISQAIISEAKARSSNEYWQDKLKRDLDKWESEREGHETDIKNLRDQVSNLNGQVEDTLKQSDEWHESYLDSQKKLESQSDEIEDLRAAGSDEAYKREQLEQEFNKRSLEMERLLTVNKELTEKASSFEITRDALSELKRKSVTSDGVLDLIAHLDADEHIKFNKHYLDNPTFRKQTFESSINDQEFLTEVVNNKYVIERIAHELRVGMTPVSERLASMGFAVVADNSKLSLADAALPSRLPMENE